MDCRVHARRGERRPHGRLGQLGQRHAYIAERTAQGEGHAAEQLHMSASAFSSMRAQHFVLIFIKCVKTSSP
jgi:hypothetical protein